MKPETCLDYWPKHVVKPISGKYTIVDWNTTSYEVFCDFDSEEGVAWTLFESFDVNHMRHLRGKPFTMDFARKRHYLNWELFRLPRSVMIEISSRSTFWRATCSYSAYGVDFRDYIRVRLLIMNPLEYSSLKDCLTMDYLDIKGLSCKNCTLHFYQAANGMLKLKPAKSPSASKCTFDTTSIKHRCNSGKGHASILGAYNMTCLDPKYRCTEKTTSTTEFWFGSVKKDK